MPVGPKVLCFFNGSERERYGYFFLPNVRMHTPPRTPTRGSDVTHAVRQSSHSGRPRVRRQLTFVHAWSPLAAKCTKWPCTFIYITGCLLIR